MTTDDVTRQIGEVRHQTIDILDRLVEKGREFELAEPPAALERYRQKLAENTYKVVVVGEAKRGKSTFVNALIGRDVLPTDVEIATGQVFNIRPSEHEAYRLLFEDGSYREVSPEDLPLYGSETTAGVVPTPDEVIRWIEVDAPVRFLPEGVSILDTPGLGSLYAGHARITHRFLPEADAVIFVLESGQPVTSEDLKFVEEILNVTSDVFFVQTKIDQHTREDWQEVLARNQEILGEQFGDRLADTTVWPVSATNLRKAASTDEKTEEAYLTVSRHRELSSALQAFLARLSGCSRAAEAMQVAGRYYATSRKALSGRLAGLTEESKQKRSEMQKIAADGKQQFEADWGPQGRKYRELREGIQQAIGVSKQSFSNSLQVGGSIELAQKAKIEEVDSLKGANRVAEEMPGEVVTEAINSWARACEEVQFRCVELLGPFAEAADGVGAPPDPGMSGLPVGDGGPDNKFKHDYFTMFRSAAGGGMITLGVGSFAAGMLPAATAATLTAVAPYVAIPAVAVLVGGGIGSALKGKVKSARGELKSQLADTLQKVRKHFFDVDLVAGSFSRVDEYFRALERSVNEQVQEIVEKKKSESQAEIDRLTEAVKLGDSDREALAEQTRERLAEWENIGKSARGVMTRIQELEKSGREVSEEEVSG